MWDWSVSRKDYPDWEALIKELDGNGVKVLTYFNPYLSPLPSGSADGRRQYLDALDRSLLVKDLTGKPFMLSSAGFEAAIMDLSNPEMRTFIKSIMKQQMSIGVRGWMADFGEALPYDGQLFSGVEGKSYHNRFPVEWAKLNRETATEMGIDDEFLFFSRSAGKTSPKFSRLFWTGDQLVGWDKYDGLKSVIPALLSSGISGMSLNHAEIGGYTSVDFRIIPGPFRVSRDYELFARWMEVSVFTSIFRTHSTQQPEKNYQWDSDDAGKRIFSKFTKVFRALKPYRDKLMLEAKENGLPLVRDLFLHYPKDKEVQKVSQQFLFGSDVLVAPVVDKGKQVRRFYLPAGRWIYLWSGRVYDVTGEWLSIAAPVGFPPVFYREKNREMKLVVERLRGDKIIAH